MPIYEYICEQCDHNFDRLVKLGSPMPDCPQCSTDKVIKKISGGSFLLKGSGWYKDGYGLRGGKENK